MRQINYGYVQLLPDFKDFLKLHNYLQFEYLLIGGYGVSYYGYRRPTADMDGWVAINPDNNLIFF